MKRNPQAVPLAGQGVAELEELKAQRTEVIAKLAKKLGVEAKDAATVEDLANAYFGQRFLITAEQMAEKDQLRLNQAEVLAMIRKGNQYINKSTDPGLGSTPAAVQADMNLIRFRSKSAITKSDEKRGIAVIPASELVAWVFANRNDYNPTEGAKESALEFRNALMEGIGALAEGGYMDALPFMINAEGDIERFGSKKHGGFPPSLKLGGMKQADLNEEAKRNVAAIRAADEASKESLAKMSPKDRAKFEAAAEKKRSDEVARDQEKTEKVKNTDPDHLIDEGREHSPKTAARPVAQRPLNLVPPSTGKAGPHPVLMSAPAKEAPPARYWDAPMADPTDPAIPTNPEFDNPLGTPDRRFVNGTEIQGDLPGMPEAPGPTVESVRPGAVGVSRPGQKVAEKRSGRFPIAPETVETRRANEDRTQLDWDLKAQKGGVPTDFTAAQMAKSVADAALTEGETKPMTPANATARAPALAREVLWQLDSFDGLHDGKKVTSDVPADPQGAFQRIQRLVAALSRPASTTGSRLAGGKHYAAPLALILTPANVKVLISKAQNKAAAGPRLERMRDKVALALLTAGDNELSLAGRVVAARALLGNDSLTSVTMKAPLKVMAEREEKRQADAMADQHFKDEAQKAKIAAVQQKRGAKPMEAKTEAPTVRELALQNQREAGWNTDWPFVPADMGNADFRELLRGDEGIPADEKAQMFAAGFKLGVVPKSEAKLNAETATKVSSDAEVAEALAYLKKTRGPEIMVEVSKDFPNAGEYLEAERLIKLSTVIGPGVLSVAYHEGLHDAWATVLKNHPGAREALSKVMSSPAMLARLQDKLANEPEALAAITTGPHAAEERVAYAYQFWAAGELDVDKPATTLFAKFRKMLRKVLGMVRESETALDIMTALHEGKLAEPSAAGRVLKEIMARETWNADMKRKFDAVVQNTFAAVAPSNDVLRRESLSGTAQLLGRILFSNPGEEAAGGDQGYLNARKQKISQYTNYLHAALKGLSERDLADVAKQLQLKTPLESISYAPVRDAVKGVRALTKRYYEYATAKSSHGEPVIRLEYLGDDHYPRVWDLRKLVDDSEGQAKFIAMLMQPKYAKAMGAAMAMANAGRKVMTPEEVGMAMVRGEKINAAYTAEQIAAKMYERLVEKNGVDDKAAESDRADDDLLDPFFASQKERSFKWLDDADVEPFLDKDVTSAMTRYLHQGIRAAEFSRRFGEHGKFLRPLMIMKGDPAINPETGEVEPSPTHGRIASEMYASLKKAGTTGTEADTIVARHMDDVRKAVAAHEGSLGHTIGPTWRKFSSAAMAYQNLRLLPLSLFAAFGDTIGIAARYGDGGGKLAFQAFTQGLRDVYARWKDAASDMPAERTKTMWENIAEMVGAVDSHMFLEQMGNAAASEFTTDWARKANRALFMANGLTAWDRSMRVSATKAAVLFLQHHAAEPDKTHSTRWLKELGLKASDIPLDADGNLIYDRHVLAASRLKGGETDDQKEANLAQATKEMDKVHYAITRWVEGAVLTPTAGQRPTWASDPHYAVLFHLKQFTYSFHHTILKRAYTEAGHGNMSPLGALMAAVPTMVAADLVKGVVLGGGSLPAYMQNWSLGDHMLHGVSRAGLGGIGQFGIDGLRDPTSLLGPTAQQASDFILNPLDLGHNLHNAVPGLRMIKGLPDLARVAE